jgi:hypothetical protein
MIRGDAKSDPADDTLSSPTRFSRAREAFDGRVQRMAVEAVHKRRRTEPQDSVSAYNNEEIATYLPRAEAALTRPSFPRLSPRLRPRRKRIRNGP